MDTIELVKQEKQKLFSIQWSLFPQSERSPIALCDIEGIEVSHGRYVLPGLSNSFQLLKGWHWIIKYRELLIAAALIFGITVFYALIHYLPRFYSDDAFSEMPLIPFGDIPLVPRPEKVKKEIDDVFGNDYVKKDEKQEETTQEGTGEGEYSVAGAVDLAFMPGIEPPRPVGSLPRLYPDVGKTEAVEAEVLTEITLYANGKVAAVTVIGVSLSKDFPPEKAAEIKAAFSATAKKILRGARFTPPVVNGERVPIKMELPLNFNLSGT